MKMNHKELLLKIEEAKTTLDSLESELSNMSDGYRYRVIVSSYGSSHTCNFINQYGVDDLVYEYHDGYDGMLDIKTTNPNYEAVEDMGCVRTLLKVSDKEFDEDVPERDISKSEAFVNTFSRGAGIID